MIVLLAESKYMNPVEGIISPEQYSAHTPVHEMEAEEIVDSLRGRSVEQLAPEMRISLRLASYVEKMVNNFSDKSRGYTPMEGYTGRAFDSLGYFSMPEESREYINKNLRLISSLYGWLTPCDIIKPYRLEFKHRILSGGLSLQDYWRGRLEADLLAITGERNDCEILNLLPVDAERCLGDFGTKLGLKVLKPDFGLGGGKITSTRNPSLMKRLRGCLLRELALEKISTFEDMKAHFGDSLIFL